MTNITGKIYQMQNAAGTENRFPRTVMEAVLGLNSYLQDQFGSLADIYMPIEGISEAFTGQEFVYRKSPNTIKAKSLTLDRIKGKTLVWNQLVAIPTSSQSRTIGGITITDNRDGSYTLSGTATERVIFTQFTSPFGVIDGHSYLIKGCPAGGSYSTYSIADGNRSWSDSSADIGNGWLFETVDSSPISLRIRIESGTTINNLTFKPQLIDITLLGESITTPSDFRALYHDAYYPYDAGTLISNDAESIETVGVNQWDEEWENGIIRLANGQNSYSATDIRSKNYIRVLPGQQYYIYCGNTSFSTFYSYFYDANKTYFGEGRGHSQVRNGIITIPAGCYYIRFTLYECSQGYGSVYRNDICINISEPAINGQYFPYWKRTMNLGLNSFKVKDSQGNITTITGGLKSAGSVYDEIVGNKYIKRVGSVDLGSLEWTPGSVAGLFLASITGQKIVVTNTKPNCICSKYIVGTTIASSANAEDKTIYQGNSNNYIYFKDTAFRGYTGEQVAEALSGVMLYYELATPIEYDLVEPLIYTTKAGTTEERISPNSDGLSAPFCCDMTYSANENNDAGNAQYAATAGRLLNTRKIWGQDFNGSEDVDGNLVSNGILQGTQLKSTVPTGTAPLVVTSTTTVANLVAEKASKLLTARTIWGRSFDGSDNISGALEGVTTISASGLATIAGGIALGTSTKAQAATMIWDETNNAWHLQGSLYADGSISAKGAISNNTDYVTQQQYNELISRIEALEG